MKSAEKTKDIAILQGPPSQQAAQYSPTICSNSLPAAWQSRGTQPEIAGCYWPLTATLSIEAALPRRAKIATSTKRFCARIKQRLRPMLGLKSVETAAIVISGMELAEKIKKGQFKIGKLRGRRAMPQEIRRATLAA